MLCGCIEDGFDTRPSAQPDFSTEELDMGIQFTDNPSPTAQLMIYNRNSKQINLSSVRLRSGRDFRINVDGQSGREFANVEIRPNDSIYVFVECTLPPAPSAEPLVMSDQLDVVTNGVTRSVTISATAQNVVRHRDETLTADATWTAEMPHIIFGELRVAPGATLTLEAGTQLLFHDKASLQVDGSLLALGTAAAPIRMQGDRTGNVVADVSYEVMSNQWEGVTFGRESAGNSLSHTEIINTCRGVELDSLATLRLENCRLTNSGQALLTARGGSKILALGSELSNAAVSLLLLEGGDYEFHRCTLANWYLFKWPELTIIEFFDAPATRAEFVNSIIYGRGDPLAAYAEKPMEMDIWFKRVMFAVEGSDDARYLQCLWEQDPLLDFSLTDYVFPYSPLPDSPALGAADPALDHPDLPPLDFRGLERALTLGAYAPIPPEKEEEI